ncbi:MAG: hypothetical protein LRY54_03870 [Alphaproteobacteria bacterium]|nr:hypothetical protein [Alphaproteobacteria bacterium]MCD8520638.1 hypothetical protein [Alphaproteobacteria bacterium]MCD8563173.1 hypothetical protein [Alphaproteobacteria bacterium]
MSNEYVESRIKEALKLSNGNTTRARQQIIAWCYEDTKLLQGLVKPHLTGIVAYNIERITSGRAQKANTPINRAPDPRAPQNDENFGMEILKSIAGNAGPMFGLEGPSAPSARRTGVSAKHIEAIKALTKGKKT